MDFNFTAEQQELRHELRKLLGDILPDDWAGLWYEHNGAEVSQAAVDILAEQGWLTYHWPREFGGQEAPIWHHIVIQEELFAHNEPRGGQYMGVNWIGPTVMRFGTQAQKEELLPEIAAGKIQWAQLYSEPNAGSDLAHLTTRATLEGDHFVINGEKIWTSYANTARRGFLLARTNPAEPGNRGISALLIPMDTPGIEVREIPSSVGWHRFHSVTFSDVKVPAESLLGELNQGWAVAMSSLPFERVGNTRYSRTTRILGLLRQIASDKVGEFAEAIADCVAMGRAAELMNYDCVATIERNEDLTWKASAGFAMNANYEQAVAALAERMLGMDIYVAAPDPRALAHGEIESFVIRQAPTVTVQAGTYQIQLSLIASIAMGFPRSR